MPFELNNTKWAFFMRLYLFMNLCFYMYGWCNAFVAIYLL